jgi:hypothetical protein
VAAPSGIPWPLVTGERALIWLGGMDLMFFSRPSDSFASQYTTPANLAVMYSSNLGTSWNSYTPMGTTYYGGASNLPTGPCAVSPGTQWSDTWTRPTAVTDPNNSSLTTLLYGERYSCNTTNLNRWRVVTFNTASAFLNAGQNLPLPQILQLNNITTSQPHTTYSHMIALNSTQLLMAYEQGNTPTTEDIYTTVLGLNSGVAIANGIKLANGVKIQGTPP